MDKQLYLIIQTNKYTGNFERELLAYVFGLDDDGYADDEELSLFREQDADDYEWQFKENFSMTHFGRYDSEYHCHKIISHPTNESYDCDSIAIAMNEELSEELWELMIKRLNDFCEYMQNKRWGTKDIKILDVSYYVSRLKKLTHQHEDKGE